MAEIAIHPTELADLASLKPHPRNYRTHPEPQLAHLDESLTEHGIYRNVVITRDGTLLAGHGVVASARRQGATKIPVVRLDLDADDPAALKIIAGDNELYRLAVDDQETLAALLTDISESALGGLLGSGFDQRSLANLLTKVNPEPPDEFGAYDDDTIPTDYRCPQCAYEWSGKPK